MRDEIEGFIPRNRRELSFTSLTDPLEGLRQPIGVVLPPQVRSTPHTGAQLRRGESVRSIIGIEPCDLASPAHARSTGSARRSCARDNPHG